MSAAEDVAAFADVEAAVEVVAVAAVAGSTAIEKSMPATLGGGIGSTCATVDCQSVFAQTLECR
jgi:hypothetical protein